MKKLIELFKTYEHALAEDTVMDHFRNIINKVLNYLKLVAIAYLILKLDDIHFLFMFYLKTG